MESLWSCRNRGKPLCRVTSFWGVPGFRSLLPSESWWTQDWLSLKGNLALLAGWWWYWRKLGVRGWWVVQKQWVTLTYWPLQAIPKVGNSLRPLKSTWTLDWTWARHIDALYLQLELLHLQSRDSSWEGSSQRTVSKSYTEHLWDQVPYQETGCVCKQDHSRIIAENCLLAILELHQFLFLFQFLIGRHHLGCSLYQNSCRCSSGTTCAWSFLVISLGVLEQYWSNTTAIFDPLTSWNPCISCITLPSL